MNSLMVINIWLHILHFPVHLSINHTSIYLSLPTCSINSVVIVAQANLPHNNAYLCLVTRPEIITCFSIAHIDIPVCLHGVCVHWY